MDSGNKEDQKYRVKSFLRFMGYFLVKYVRNLHQSGGGVYEEDKYIKESCSCYRIPQKSNVNPALYEVE